jgi:CRP/FNR family transcriptional regulator, cyclic AMP receptor protein
MDTSIASTIEILAGMSLFANVSITAMTELAKLCEERVFSQGEVVFEEGTPGNSMMVIVSGEVRISQRPSSGAEETLMVLKKGDFFGEMALLDTMPRSATVIAHHDIFLLEISRERFLNFVNSDPDSGVLVLLSLARHMTSRLREANNKIKSFITMSQWI